MVSQAANACSPAVEHRSFGERLAAAPVAFVGTVSAVDGARTTFVVEHVLHPSSLGKSFSFDQPVRSTCTNVFEVGQRWLFAGGNTYEPSIRLNVGASAAAWDADKLGRLQRHDDRSLELPTAFSRCNSDAQCTALAYNCTSTAVNTSSVTQARHHVFAVKKAGRPETVSCPSPDQTKGLAMPAPMCHAGRCGAWSLVF